MMKLNHVWVCLLLGVLAGCEMGADQAPAPQVSAPPAPAEPARPTVVQGMMRFGEDFQQALAEAQRDGKPLLVFFTAEWCHYCHQMAGEAFVNPQVVDLSQRFVCVLIDADAQAEVCRQFRVSAYPTVQFVSPQGMLLNRMEGKRPSNQVMMAMQTALQASAERTPPRTSSLR